MSDLPLQPRGQPWPPRLRRWAVLLALALAVLLAGWCSPRPGAVAQPLVGGPDQPMAYAREVRRLIDRAERRVWMVMYVVRVDDGPIGALLQALADATARGVDVRVCLDLGSAWDGQADLKHEAPAAWLSAHGVRVLLDEPNHRSHAKILVVDDRYVLSGSHNWTRSALTDNREVSWLIDDPAVADELMDWMRGIPGW